MDEQTASIALFGHDIAPLSVERCAVSLELPAGSSPRGAAPVAVRKARGDGFTVRAAAVSGFHVPGNDALVSVRLALASGELSPVDIRTDGEAEASPGASAALTVGGFSAAKRLARALRAAADAVDLLEQDVAQGAVTTAVAEARRVATIRPPTIAPMLPPTIVPPAMNLSARTADKRALAAARARDRRARKKAQRLAAAPAPTRKRA